MNHRSRQQSMNMMRKNNRIDAIIYSILSHIRRRLDSWDEEINVPLLNYILRYQSEPTDTMIAQVNDKVMSILPHYWLTMSTVWPFNGVVPDSFTVTRTE